MCVTLRQAFFFSTFLCSSVGLRALHQGMPYMSKYSMFSSTKAQKPGAVRFWRQCLYWILRLSPGMGRLSLCSFSVCFSLFSRIKCSKRGRTKWRTSNHICHRTHNHVAGLWCLLQAFKYSWNSMCNHSRYGRSFPRFGCVTQSMKHWSFKLFGHLLWQLNDYGCFHWAQGRKLLMYSWATAFCWEGM